MSIESEFFKRSRPDFARMKAFGFRKDRDKYCYSEDLMGGQFRATLEVSGSGEIRGELIDNETGEEYLPIRVRYQVGEFVGEVREAYMVLLDRIEKACFAPVHFVYDQSNRIAARISSKYGSDPEFPWEKFPGNATFKCPDNDKWFGAILTVAFDKLGDEESKAGSRTHDADEIVEVINLKAEPEDIPRLIKRPGVHPAWHMNKKNWISVILDDTLTDEEVMELIARSFELVSAAKGKKVKSTGAWMIPSNPKVYNVDAGFRGGRGEIEWHQHNQVEPGDQVFIYCSAPYSAIIYRCEVVEADLPYRGMFRESKGYQKSMRIRLIEKYPPGLYDLKFIKAHGGSVVRSARSMPKELFEAIKRG